MTGKAVVLRADAAQLPLPDESVDLIITSPPYFALRSYRDGDEHYSGQIGSEPTPQEFLEALWTVTREMKRVLKPSGSIFVNLGDKYAGSGGHNNSNLARLHQNYGRPETERHQLADEGHQALRRNAPDRYNQNSNGIPAKSLMGLPWRYAIGCIDHLGLILRAEIVWDKPNGLPESVTDRVRRSHEQWFHMTKQGRYFAAVDEIREPHRTESNYRNKATEGSGGDMGHFQRFSDGLREFNNPLGKLPGSVWRVPSEPLIVPEWAKTKFDLPDHFAAFPQEWPRRLILGWSPSGICTACGEGRRPVVDAQRVKLSGTFGAAYSSDAHGADGRKTGRFESEATITGYACACPTPEAPTRNSVVLDPFGGTGTVAMVAKALGRIGISVDLSADYCRLAEWRINHSGHGKKAEQRTWGERQESLM